MAVELEGLELQISTSADQAVSGIESLTAALSGLRTATEGGAGLRTVTAQLSRISSALSSLPQSGTSNLQGLISSLERLSQGEYGNSGLNNVARQVQKVNAAINSINLDETKVQQLRTLQTALSGLGSIQAASGLNSTVNALLKLPKLSEQLSAMDMDKFADQIRKAAQALEPLATQMDRVSRGFQAFPIRIQRIIQQSEQLDRSNRRTAGSFGVLNNAISLISFRMLARYMGQWVSQSNAYVENLNLFSVAMGDASQSAYDYAQTVKDAVGIDPSDWMRNQGVFMQIASGFGVANDKAVLMSQNLTQLGYDISSFFNINVEEAMQKVQSGISGELEPLRRLGYALDQATLKEIARSEGITKSFNAMTQAEKSQLRYIAIMRQSTNAMGDMARTVITPANAMRILQQQIQQLTRALGNLLIPFLLKLIPVVQAVVEVLTEFISLLASLAGFTLPKIDYSGLGGVTAGAEAAEDAIDAATAAAKRFSTTLGIDELNIISPPDQGGSGADGAGGGFADLDLPSYDFLKDVIEQSDTLKNILREILYDLVIPIGLAFAGWKISDKLQSAIAGAGGLGDYLKRLKTFAGIAVAAVGAVVALRNAFDAFYNGLTMWNLAGILGGLAAVVGGLYLAFGTIGAGVGAAAAAVVTFTVAWRDLSENGLNSKNLALFAAFSAAIAGIAATLGGPIAIAVGGAAAAIGLLANAIDVAAEASYLDGQTMEKVFAGIKLAASVATIGIGLAFGPIPGIIAGVAVGAVGLAAALRSDAIPAIEVLDDSISDATKKAVEPFLDATSDLAVQFKKLRFSKAIIDDSVIQDTMAKVESIVTTITDSLDSAKNERLASLNPLQGMLSDEMYQSVMEKTGAYYEGLATSVAEGQAEINQILAEAQANNGVVTEAGWERINEIQAQMQDIGIQSLSASQVEYETIMRNLRDNSARISLEQASAIIQDAQRARDETIAAAETQYTEIILQAEQLRDAGVINREEYEAMISAAEDAREQTVTQANEQYSGIYNAAMTNLGELARFIDESNGDIKTKWSVFWEDAVTSWNDLWGDLLSGVEEWWGNVVDFWDVEVPKWWDDNVAPWFTVEKWKELGKQALDGLFEGLKGMWDKASDWGEDLLASVKDALGIASPSKEFKEIGEYSIAGMEKGFDGMGDVTASFKTELAKMLGNGQEFADTTKTLVDNGLSTFLSTLTSAQEGNSRATDTMTSNYRTMASNSNSAISSIITKLNEIPRSITTVHTVITKTETASSSTSGSSSKAKGYATGGFPRAGELFYARENGLPELVGSINGQTAVANNDQIVEAVAQGVAQAVQAVLANSEMGGEPSFNIYLDSRQIRAGIERADQEAGAGIMKGGSY